MYMCVFIHSSFDPLFLLLLLGYYYYYYLLFSLWRNGPKLFITQTRNKLNTWLYSPFNIKTFATLKGFFHFLSFVYCVSGEWRPPCCLVTARARWKRGAGNKVWNRPRRDTKPRYVSKFIISRLMGQKYNKYHSWVNVLRFSSE